jgi:iron complex outermembrane receptor protein
MKVYKLLNGGAALVALLAAASTVQAQTAEPAASAAQAAPNPAEGQNGLEEIVVTAEKRIKTEQKTPIAMTVLTADFIKSNGIKSLEDLASVAPMVSFAQDNVATIVVIRGVSSRDTTEIGDPDISISVDGFYVIRAIGLNDSVFDLERVEVLRGPQGTLYGRNSVGGAINFITAKPKDDFDASASVGFGNYNLLTTDGMVNVPLSDKVQLRAAFQTTSHDGYRDNAPAQDGDDADAKAGRLMLKAEPTDNFTALLTAEVVKLGGVGPAVEGVPIAYGTNGQTIHQVYDKPVNGEDFPLSLPSGYLNSISKAARWNFNYDFGFADLTYIGGYRKLDYHDLISLSGLESAPLYFQANEAPETWNHELRLSSKNDDALTWQIGGFYFKERNTLLTDFQQYTAATPANLFIFSYPDLVTRSKAVFGQGTYAILDDLKIEFGMRYSSDSKHRAGFLNYGSGIDYEDGRSNSSKTTFHAALDWQATPDNLLYAKFDTGYKAGGFTDAGSYAPEYIKSYEAGAKNRFFDNRVQLNGDGFYYQYTNQQISQFVNGMTYIRNAGASEIYGVELDGSVLATPVDRFDAFIGLLHAEFTNFEVAINNANVQLAGNHPPQSPRTSINAGYQHIFNVWNGNLTARIQTHFETSSNLTFYNYQDDRQPSYTRSDVILTYETEDGKWSVEGYVRNLENAAVYSNAAENPLFNAYTYQLEPPRTYGVRLTANW